VRESIAVFFHGCGRPWIMISTADVDLLSCAALCIWLMPVDCSKAFLVDGFVKLGSTSDLVLNV